MKGGKPHYRVYMLLVKQSGGCMELTDPVDLRGQRFLFLELGLGNMRQKVLVKRGLLRKVRQPF